MTNLEVSRRRIRDRHAMGEKKTTQPMSLVKLLDGATLPEKGEVLGYQEKEEVGTVLVGSSGKREQLEQARRSYFFD
ncbi:hypothetical protein M8J76_011195 [Diaphorina citri]|nr:hypothetical protein M8J76_011195 [Diaphorina citri]